MAGPRGQVEADVLGFEARTPPDGAQSLALRGPGRRLQSARGHPCRHFIVVIPVIFTNGAAAAIGNPPDAH